ncbi:MAG: hypothetical protein ACRDBG_13275 [Waterburya sp.]
MRILNYINATAELYNGITPENSELVADLLLKVKDPVRLRQLLETVHPVVWASWSSETYEALLTKANL